MKTAHVNGTQFQALIDTGCSVCLIRSSAAVKSGTVIPTMQPLYVIGDMEVPGMQTIGRMSAEISIGQVHTSANELLVVPDKAIPTDLLIGRSWLDLPIVSYYKLNNELVIAPTTADRQVMYELPQNENDVVASDIGGCLVVDTVSDQYDWHADQFTGRQIPGD